MIIEILLASFIVMLAALGGAFSFFKVIGKTIEKHLGLLISFTAGIFLFVSYELGKETIYHSPNVETGLFWIVSGMVGVWLLFKLLPHSHEHEKEKSLDIRKILVGNGIHNIGDGVLLAAAFSTDIRLGIITTISVFIHELVQETSIFFVLRRAGFAIKKALLINFSVSGTILIGSVGSMILLSFFKFIEAPLLGLSAGAFLIVVLQDLIPHSINDSCYKKCYLSHILAFVIGIIIMLFLSFLMPHTHDHDCGHEEHHHHHTSQIINV